MRQLSYDDWLKAVDQHVWTLVFCSIHDLPDIPLRDFYDAGVTSCTAAKRAIAYANDEDDWDEE